MWKKTRDALYGLPTYFHSETHISGIRVPDIFTLNAPLGAAIEDQMVATLNQMRAFWDTKNEYQNYSFIRRPQTFPDVVLRAHDGAPVGEEIILGVELKGWYLLAKEGMPNFRMVVTPSACAVADLIAVVPWVLSNVISGIPRVFKPYVESARYASEFKNYWWQEIREAQGSREIKAPPGAKPYPTKAEEVSDRPASDQGGNFGRLARTGLLNDYLERALSQDVCGIEARFWLDFFKKHSASEK